MVTALNTQQWRNKRAACAAAIGLAVIALVTTPAHADSTSALAARDQLQQLRDFYSDWGVTGSAQDGVLEEFRTTGYLDAFGSVEPVSTKHTIKDGMSYEIATFEDGSIAVSGVEIATRNATTGSSQVIRSITGCTVTSGTGWAHYANCKVHADDGVHNFRYTVTYEKYSQANAKLMSSSEAKITCIWGSCTAPERSLWRPQSTATQDAVVKYHSQYTSWNNAASEDIYLSLYLSKTGVPTVLPY